MDLLITPEETRDLVKRYARESEKNLTVILGAGASLGYSRNNNYSYKPPAVAQLLSDANVVVSRIIDKPEHTAVKGQRRHIERSIGGFGGDLEAYLSDLYGNDTEDDLFPHMLRYLEDLFTLSSMHVDLDDNHYQSLLNKLRDLRGSRPWSILTFNYDTILEQSIANMPRFVPGRTFRTDSEYLMRNPKVLKMHGGVNFRYITIGPTETEIDMSAHEIFTKMMGDTNSVESYLETAYLGHDVPHFTEYRNFPEIGAQRIYNFPLMMIPIHTRVQSANTFFGRQIDLAKIEVSESELTIAVGYQFGDNTFIDALRDIASKDSNLLLIGTNQLAEEGANSKAYKAASRVWDPKKIRIFEGNGFGEFVDSLY